MSPEALPDLILTHLLQIEIGSSQGSTGMVSNPPFFLTAENKALVGRQSGSHALLGLGTSDCLADYTRMKPLGVKFLGERQSGPWGTGVQLEDVYGNKVFISREP